MYCCDFRTTVLSNCLSMWISLHFPKLSMKRTHNVFFWKRRRAEENSVMSSSYSKALNCNMFCRRFNVKPCYLVQRLCVVIPRLPVFSRRLCLTVFCSSDLLSVVWNAFIDVALLIRTLCSMCTFVRKDDSWLCSILCIILITSYHLFLFCVSKCVKSGWACVTSWTLPQRRISTKTSHRLAT